MTTAASTSLKGLEVRGHVSPDFAEILTPEALRFVEALVRDLPAATSCACSPQVRWLVCSTTLHCTSNTTYTTLAGVIKTDNTPTDIVVQLLPVADTDTVDVTP